MFAVSGSALIVNASLDYETAYTFPIYVRSQDYSGEYTEQAFVITVNNLNDNPPNISGATVTLPENSLPDVFVFDPQISDVDQLGTLTCSIIGGNTNNAFKISNNRIYVKTTGAFDYETTPVFNLLIRASDGYNTTDATLVVKLQNLNDNMPLMPNRTVYIDENSPNNSIAFVIDATDADGTINTITYSIQSGNTDNAFVLNGNNIQVSNTTILDFETTPKFDLTIRMYDGAHYNNSIITVKLNNQNDNAPNQFVNEVTIDENTAIGVTVFILDATDPDGTLNTLSYKLKSGSTNDAFIFVSYNVVAYNTAYINFEQYPEFVLQFEITDGIYTTAGQLTILLQDVNEAPKINKEVERVVAFKNEAFEYDFSEIFLEEDAGDQLTYNCTLPDGSAVPAWFNYSAGSSILAGTPVHEDMDTFNIKLTARDNFAHTTQWTLRVEVNDTNDPPELANPIPDQAVNEGDNFLFTFAENTFFEDDENDFLTYSAKLSDDTELPDWLSFTPSTRTFSGTPTSANLGAITVKVTATDRMGFAAIDFFVINVVDINNAPFVMNEIPDQYTNEDEVFSFTFSDRAFLDIDIGDQLSYSAALSGSSQLPQWLSFNSQTRTFTGTPTNDLVGSYSITVVTVDLFGAFASDQFTIYVKNVNDLPQLNNELQDQEVSVGSEFLFVIPANTFIDVDVSDELTYSISMQDNSAIPAWISFNATTRTIRGTPTYAQTLYIKVTVTDEAGAKAHDVFILSVHQNSTPFVLNAIPDMTATVGIAYIYEIPANTFMDPDEHDELKYHASLNDNSPLPAWLDFSGNPPTLSGVPVADGTLIIKILAYDIDSAYVSDMFVLTINKNTAINDLLTVPAFSVYPNPVYQAVNISVPANMITGNETHFQLIDSQGKIVYRQIISKQLFELNLQHLKSGIYIAKIVKANKTVFEETIIKMQ